MRCRICIPSEYSRAVKAIQAATDRAVGLNFSRANAENTIPMPMTRMPPMPVIRLASCAGKWNCDSRYLGMNVYKPAIGSKCNTDDAVRNIRISFFKWRLIVLGKSVVLEYWKWRRRVFYYFIILITNIKQCESMKEIEA